MAEDKTAETANTEQSTNHEADASSDLDGLNDEITSMRAHIAKLNEENKKHRLRAKDEQEAKISALQENGEFKELATALQGKVEILERDLPEMKAKAAKYDDFQGQEAERIAKAVEAVPESWRAVINNAGDLNTKRQILEVLQSTKTATPSAQASAPSNNSTPSSAKDIAKAWIEKNAQSNGLFNR